MFRRSLRVFVYLLLAPGALLAQSFPADSPPEAPRTAVVSYAAPAPEALLADVELAAAVRADALGRQMAAEEPGPAPATAPDSLLTALSATERYGLGQADARRHYKGGKGLFWVTFGATSAVPYGVGAALGLGGLAAVAATPPKPAKLNAPYPERLHDADYYRGYRQRVQARRTGKAAAGLGVAIGLQVAGLLLLFHQGL
ncbi:hypothetical protein [Hymenobacter latericus]|uniref:hypothetical protein n=1 Tax=Hymenobacter sp. YIM 151858-1 TaxID=2987688 RepID=UPI002226761D|nr:hypothetical protein [Hymenobacter sp. YIM 151858-1]UYZ58007.1 hypothetical protein OIS50_13175 [Hymenobacter sp. YIM 151858-1]